MIKLHLKNAEEKPSKAKENLTVCLPCNAMLAMQTLFSIFCDCITKQTSPYRICWCFGRSYLCFTSTEGTVYPMETQLFLKLLAWSNQSYPLPPHSLVQLLSLHCNHNPITPVINKTLRCFLMWLCLIQYMRWLIFMQWVTAECFSVSTLPGAYHMPYSLPLWQWQKAARRGENIYSTSEPFSSLQSLST